MGLSAASNLTLSGGVFESSGILIRGLGSGSGAVQIIGGPAALAPIPAPDRPQWVLLLFIDIGGNGTGTGAPLVWGTAAFNPVAFLLNDTTRQYPAPVPEWNRPG